MLNLAKRPPPRRRDFREPFSRHDAMLLAEGLGLIAGCAIAAGLIVFGFDRLLLYISGAKSTAELLGTALKELL